MPGEEQPERIPVHHQEYLTIIEQFNSMRGQTIAMEPHVLLMTAISNTIAAIDYEEPSTQLSSQWFLERNRAWLEFAVEQMPGLLQSAGASFDIQTKLEQMVAHLLARGDAVGRKRYR